jgi:hypothetical protein
MKKGPRKAVIIVTIAAIAFGAFKAKDFIEDRKAQKMLDMSDELVISQGDTEEYEKQIEKMKATQSDIKGWT